MSDYRRLMNEGRRAIWRVPGNLMCEPVSWDLPKGCHLLAMRYNKGEDCLDILLGRSDFPRIPEGELAPVIGTTPQPADVSFGPQKHELMRVGIKTSSGFCGSRFYDVATGREFPVTMATIFMDPNGVTADVTMVVDELEVETDAAVTKWNPVSGYSAAGSSIDSVAIRFKTDAPVTLGDGVVSVCPECKGTGQYQGLVAIEPCKACEKSREGHA